MTVDQKSHEWLPSDITSLNVLQGGAATYCEDIMLQICAKSCSSGNVPPCILVRCECFYLISGEDSRTWDLRNSESLLVAHRSKGDFGYLAAKK